MRLIRVALLAVCGLYISACSQPSDQAPTTGLTDDELAIDAPEMKSAGSLDSSTDAETNLEQQLDVAPIVAANAGQVQIELTSESAYLNERKKYVVDVLERDMAYLTFTVHNHDGRPVQGAKLQYAMRGTSQIVPMGNNPLTNETGGVEIGVVGGKMGSDTLTVSYGKQSLDILINVISLKAAGIEGFVEPKGSLSWDALMSARLQFDAGDTVSAKFPADIAAQHGKTVQLIGFMMPLEPDKTQKHFLLTANPPSCFFHIPGGPAGAVEVFSQKGIDASWDVVLLKGRFETVSGGELGVVYRLHDAQVVTQ